jgi:hypothetical protein
VLEHADQRDELRREQHHRGIRKTIVVWYDWFRGVPTTNSCADAAIAPRIANGRQPGCAG